MAAQITLGQKHEIKKFAKLALKEVLDELGLSQEAAERVIENGALCQDLLKERFRSVLTRLSTPYAYEEVDSSEGYPSGYRAPHSVIAQANKLRELFPGIGYANESLADSPVPQGAEGKFVIPRWQKIAPTYVEAVQVVLDKLRVVYSDAGFYDLDAPSAIAQGLREGAAKMAAFRKIGDDQAGYDLLVIDGQFGILHRGRSVRRARVVMETAGQFGFGAFEVGIMLLTHAHRFQHRSDLWIDCAGDEYFDETDDRCLSVPLFYGDECLDETDGRFLSVPIFDGDEFGIRGDCHENEGGGSASGFYPQ